MAGAPLVSTGRLKADGRQTVTTAGTAVRLSTTSIPCTYVKVQAELDNTGVVAVGASTVVAAVATRRGVGLAAGDIDLVPAVDVRDVWVDAATNTEGVTFQVFN